MEPLQLYQRLVVAATGILFAAVAISLLKAGIAVYVGGRQLAATVAVPLLGVIVAGGLGILVGEVVPIGL